MTTSTMKRQKEDKGAGDGDEGDGDEGDGDGAATRGGLTDRGARLAARKLNS